MANCPGFNAPLLFSISASTVNVREVADTFGAMRATRPLKFLSGQALVVIDTDWPTLHFRNRLFGNIDPNAQRIRANDRHDFLLRRNILAKVSSPLGNKTIDRRWNVCIRKILARKTQLSFSVRNVCARYFNRGIVLARLRQCHVILLFQLIAPRALFVVKRTRHVAGFDQLLRSTQILLSEI